MEGCFTVEAMLLTDLMLDDDEAIENAPDFLFSIARAAASLATRTRAVGITGGGGRVRSLRGRGWPEGFLLEAVVDTDAMDAIDNVRASDTGRGG